MEELLCSLQMNCADWNRFFDHFEASIFSKTTITVTIFISIRTHLRTCICIHDWCNGARAEYIFGNSSVALTSDILERSVWFVHLGLDANLLELPAYPRVWVEHYHWIDIQVVKGVNDESVFDEICLKLPTKFVEYETGNSSMLAPPRPSATKMEARGSLLARRTLSFEDFLLLSADVHAKKRNKRSLPMPQSISSSGSTGCGPSTGGNAMWRLKAETL
jgi:hypothetical protein